MSPMGTALIPQRPSSLLPRKPKSVEAVCAEQPEEPWQVLPLALHQAV